MSNLTIRYSPLSALRPHPRNPRTHTKAQIRRIADSIQAFGFTNPVLIDSEDNVLAGHGRVEAARLLGLDTVPTIRLGELTEAQKRAYTITDNRIAELAGWDLDILAEELRILSDLDVDFDLTLTGFDTPQIDLMLQSNGSGTDPIDEDWEPEATEGEPPASRVGDLWLLGPHRLLCGNALEADDYTRLMDGAKAQMVFTDPPYNVAIQGHVSGLGRTRHAEFVMASGEMTSDEFTTFLRQAFELLGRHSCDGSIHFVFMDWRHQPEITAAGQAAYTELKNLCVWCKDNAGMGSFYRSQHELILVFKNGRARHINNFELGQHGRHRSNVWAYPGMNGLSPGRGRKLEAHPTLKPAELVADAILDCSDRGGIVLDPFAGSGTLFIAAEHTSRRAYGMELHPNYVDQALRRWQRFSGRPPVHAATGQPFESRDVRTNAADGGPRDEL